MTIDITTQTPEELQRLAEEAARAAEQAQAELDRRAAQQEAERQVLVVAQDRSLIERHIGLDQDLEERGKQYGEEFDQAVRDRDLPAAFAAWVNQRSTREARRHIRNEAINAEDRVKTGWRVLPELRYYEPDLLERLQSAGDAAAVSLGADLADQLLAKD